MKNTEINQNGKKYIMTTGSFVNEAYKKEWMEFVPNMKDREGNPIRYADATFCADEGNDFAVYDGGQNYMGRVNRKTGEIEFNGAKDEYKSTFLEAAKKVICG